MSEFRKLERVHVKADRASAAHAILLANVPCFSTTLHDDILAQFSPFDVVKVMLFIEIPFDMNITNRNIGRGRPYRTKSHSLCSGIFFFKRRCTVCTAKSSPR
jgi:hypothetical protein